MILNITNFLFFFFFFFFFLFFSIPFPEEPHRRRNGVTGWRLWYRYSIGGN